jgi:hypothetical protein
VRAGERLRWECNLPFPGLQGEVFSLLRVEVFGFAGGPVTMRAPRRSWRCCLCRNRGTGGSASSLVGRFPSISSRMTLAAWLMRLARSTTTKTPAARSGKGTTGRREISFRSESSMTLPAARLDLFTIEDFA